MKRRSLDEWINSSKDYRWINRQEEFVRLNFIDYMSWSRCCGALDALEFAYEVLGIDDATIGDVITKTSKLLHGERKKQAQNVIVTIMFVSLFKLCGKDMFKPNDVIINQLIDYGAIDKKDSVFDRKEKLYACMEEAKENDFE